MGLTTTGAARFALAGELGFDTVTQLLEDGEDVFALHPVVEVDLAGVTRCDSSAVALLLEWVRGVHGRGARIIFKNLPKSLVAIASISDVDTLLPTA